jgi:hypothetical protein
MRGIKELRLFDHFVGAGEGKMRGCNLSFNATGTRRRRRAAGLA